MRTGTKAPGTRSSSAVKYTWPSTDVYKRQDEDQPAASIQDKADFESIDTESITFAFDTVYIVRKKSETVDLAPLRAYLDSIGDSLVIGEDDESFKVHVHTNIPVSYTHLANFFTLLSPKH